MGVVAPPAFTTIQRYVNIQMCVFLYWADLGSHVQGRRGTGQAE